MTRLAYRFEVSGLPRPQGSKTARSVGRPCSACGQRRTAMAESARGLKVWRKLVQSAAVAVRQRVLDGPVVLSAQFRFARPKSHWTRSGRLTQTAPRQKVSAPDLSKLIRAVEDAITDAGLWADDRLVVGYLDVTKVWCAADDEGCTVTIYEVFHG